VVFLSSSAAKGNTVCMLAFEVANTIVRGCNLMCSVSKPSIDHLKEVVLRSEGVQLLISKDLDELLKMAAADKRLVPILHFISCILTYSCLLYILPFQIYIERDVLQPLLSSIQILNPLTSTGKS
jgi:hypothetical protein